MFETHVHKSTSKNVCSNDVGLGVILSECLYCIVFQLFTNNNFLIMKIFQQMDQATLVAAKITSMDKEDIEQVAAKVPKITGRKLTAAWKKVSKTTFTSSYHYED